ncbi:hypothetical protein Pla110_44240 [Polystyrenella longa]|uniref:Uncharacterized protein n=1 Tax=Polystyrenella longa TaxID=2528007 RepID=A0A518CTV8_9PLAN|nr:hypothetical protein [Polystyrenella longa]QDU82663.1 hypothetical protein Pla110_44240 [Polystyrenella longa]
MATESLTINSNVNTLWSVYDYTNITASGGGTAIANRLDDNKGQQWSTSAPVAEGTVTQVDIDVRHYWDDDAENVVKPIEVKIRIGGVWSSAQTINTSASGYAYTMATFTGSWPSEGFIDFAFEIKPGSISNSESYFVDHVVAPLLTYTAYGEHTKKVFGLGESDNTVGTIAWNSPTNIYTSNDLFAAAPGLGTATLSEYLKATTLGYALAGKTILGIQLVLERQTNIATMIDNSIRLCKAGTPVGDDKATTTPWRNGADRFDIYGGPADLWGTTWAIDDINNSGFGALISAKTIAGNGVARVDYGYFRIFTEDAPPSFIPAWAVNANRMIGA